MSRYQAWLVTVILAAPAVAEAQPGAKVYRIGMLERTPMSMNAANVDAVRKGLHELGYVEGRNVIIEYRSVDGRNDQYAKLMKELVDAKVDAVLARGTAATLAGKNAPGATPVIMTGIGDPVAMGIVDSLARPGGKVTGLTAYTRELYAKRVEILKELMPGVSRIGALFNLSEPNAPIELKQIELAARVFNIDVRVLDVRAPDDLVQAFADAGKQQIDAVVVSLLAITQANHRLIVDLAVKHRLPAIYASASEFPGGLISYGVDYPDLYRRSASFADKIFKGAKPGELPVEQPTKFELVINIKTAKALGLSVPNSLLLRADQIIER